MNHPNGKPALRAPLLSLERLFAATAYDLKVQQHPEYLSAYAALCAGQYHRFVLKLDAMTSQMYTSTDSERFGLHQLAALLSKYPFVDETIDRDAVALEKFRQSEWRCRRMNQKLRARRLRVEPPHMKFMRDYIAKVIGHYVPLNLIASRCDFGPGSSVGVHGADTSFVRKLRHLTCTPALEPVALYLLQNNLHYAEILHNGVTRSDDQPDFQVRQVSYNKITCVPKNAKTNRTIAIEPTLNGFVQKGIDHYFRGRLLRIGIDLSTQALNQALARLGSRGRGYATIDLSSASDSISVQLIRELLPAEWFNFLDIARSPSYMLPDGSTARYEKFCSMGNGFCFPLETLIFRAACEYAMSVTQLPSTATVAVYGDDIIVPQAAALILLEVLRDLGFRQNESKTFIVGDFRESCGADYFEGKNVRPIYVKRETRLDHNVFPLLNALRQKGFQHAWHTVFNSVPGRHRYLRPYSRDDDSAITVPSDLFMGSRYARWNRELQTWAWIGIAVRTSPAGKPVNEYEEMAGKLRGDLSLSETFSARFGERTARVVKT